MSAPITVRDVVVATPDDGEVTFHVNETGPVDAPTILWLHGSGPGATGSTNWDWMIGELGDEYHCVAPDIIGFGDSTHPNPPPQGLKLFTELRVRTLIALLDALRIDKVTVVGNSMGGIISLALVTAHPERVDKIVLMGSGGAPTGLTPELLKLILFYEDPTTEAMAELMTCFVHDSAFFGDDLDKIAAARMPRALRADVERSHRATFGPGDPLSFPPELLAKIDIPVLVVHGANDRIMLVAAGEYFAEHLPNAELHVFDETGHWLQLERPQRFADLLRAFLKETGS
jgi:2-hydroxymuconate-semialdehyde hydrolase